jgi:hypothetical protein
LGLLGCRAGRLACADAALDDVARARLAVGQSFSRRLRRPVPRRARARRAARGRAVRQLFGPRRSTLEYS